MAKSTQQQQLDTLTQAVAALAAQLQGSSPAVETAEPSKPSSKQNTAKAVKDENAAEPPTSKQGYILLMRARDCGLDSFTMPTTRGAAADLIGAVLNAKSKAAKVKLLNG